MRYESEILYDLMKRDGLLNPSQDNLPYESELKEKYVNEVEGAYPKLQDYRAEWLNYNKCEYIPADFPTESQTNQTSGTFQNVIPFAYDVATLKGQTLVNLLDFDNKVTHNIQNVNKEINKISWTTRKYYSKLGFKINVNPNTSYCIYYSSKTEFTICYRNAESIDTDAKQPQILNDNFIKITSESNSIITITFEYKSEVATHEVYDLMVFEYQDGMENWNIPYFEGMQSVQMPMLTTTGKNLFNKDNAYLAGASNQNIRNDIFIKPNKTYTFYANENNWVGAYLYDKNNELTREVGNTKTSKSITFTTTSEEVKAVLQYHNGGNTTIAKTNFTGVQLEYGTEITAYEPYHSITTSANMTLRGIGNVKDELDLTTGEVTQRIGEIVFDGSDDEDWGVATEGDTINGFSVWKNMDNAHHKDLVCDKLSYFDYSDLKNDKTQFISCLQQSRIIVVNIKGLSSVDEVKQWLSKNPITVQYKLATESVRTVDLTIIDEDNAECDLVPIMDIMHYQTSSDTIPPLADLTVCVEATTQNLASFVHLEGAEENE